MIFAETTMSKKPECCGSCPLFVWEQIHGFCPITGEQMASDEQKYRSGDCPLKDIPSDTPAALVQPNPKMQLLTPENVVAVIRKNYVTVLSKLREAETEHEGDKRSVKKRELYQFLGAQEQLLSNLGHELGISLWDENWNPIPGEDEVK